MEPYLHNRSGHEILNTTINHNLTIGDLFDHGVNGTSWYHRKIKKRCSPPTEMFTPGLTNDKVADVLETYGF